MSMSLMDPSLLPPPTEVNDTNKVYSTAAWIIVLGVIASTCVLTRLVLRYRTGSLGMDDWAIIPALVFYVGWTAMAAYINLHAGVGKPLWEITMGEFAVWFQGIFACLWMYPAATALIRISILLFYDRLFSTPMSRFKYWIRGMLVLQVLYLITFSILPAFVCSPLERGFNPFERPLYCNDFYYVHISIAQYSCSMVMDIFLLVLPLPSIYKLQTSWRNKLGIVVLFALGTGASVAAAYKLAIFVVQWRRYGHIDPRWLQYQLSRVVPPQFDQYATTFWIPSQVEPTVALIGTSIPSFHQFVRPLTKRWAQKLSSYISTSGTNSSLRSRKLDSGHARRAGKPYSSHGSHRDYADEEHHELNYSSRGSAV